MIITPPPIKAIQSPGGRLAWLALTRMRRLSPICSIRFRTSEKIAASRLLSAGNRIASLNIAVNLGVSSIYHGHADAEETERVGGLGGYALDFLPQSFMVALMSALVPGAKQPVAVFQV